MTLYGNNRWTSILFWKKLKRDQLPGVFFLARDSEVDAPESTSQTHFEFIKRSIIFKTF